MERKKGIFYLNQKQYSPGSHPDSFYIVIHQRQTAWCQMVPMGEGTRGFRHPGDRTGPVPPFLRANITELQLYHRKPQQQDGRVLALASMLSSAVCSVPR